MLATLKDFLIAEDGGVIEWVITIIAGSLLGVIAYSTLKKAPGDIGNGVSGAGTRAGTALNDLAK
jgi:hypothetical protein